MVSQIFLVKERHNGNRRSQQSLECIMFSTLVVLVLYIKGTRLTSATETKKLLSGTVTQETRETQTIAKRSKIRDILKKTETAFLKATQDSNNHR